MLNELIVKIGADVKEFQSNMQKVSNRIDDAGQSIKNVSAKAEQSMNEMSRNITNRFNSTFNTFSQNVNSKIGSFESKFIKATESMRWNWDRTVRSQTSAWNDFVKDTEQRTQDLQDIGGAITTYLGLPLTVAAGASIKLASDFEESLNKVKVAFGTSAQQVISWSQTSTEAMGLASGSALDAAALFGDMATSMGISRNRAADMAMSLTQLGADLASFKNIPIEQAMQALNGVFTGETESLKMLGVVMTQTQLQAFALTQGITKQVDKMTEAEMVALRYAFVMDRTKNAQGDFARTSQGAANQMRMFGENMKQLGVEFGQIVLPAFTDLLRKVNDLTKGVSDMSTGQKEATIAIGGTVVGLGALATATGIAFSVWDKIKDIWAIAINRLKALGARFGYIGMTLTLLTATINEWSKNWSLKSKLIDLMWQGTVKDFEIGVNHIETFFKRFIVKILEDTQIFIKQFRALDIALMDFRKGLESAIDSKRTELELLRQDKAFIQSEKVIYMNKLAVAELRDQQLETMSNYQSFTQHYANYSLAYQDDIQKSIEKNDQLAKSQEEAAKKAAEALEKLKSDTIKQTNEIGNAIMTALRNRQKATDEEIKDLDRRKTESVKFHEDQLRDIKKSYDEQVKLAEDANSKIIDSINKRYDKEQELIATNLEKQIKPYQDKISAIEDSITREQEAIAEQEFEMKKSEIAKQMALSSSAEHRAKVTDELASYLIASESKLLEKGKTLRYDNLIELTDEENALIKKRLNDARELEKKSLNLQIDMLKQDAAMQAVIEEARRTSELQKQKEAFEEEKTRINNIHALRESVRLKDYNSLVKYYDDEIAKLKKNYVDYSDEVKAQDEAKSLLMSQNHSKLMDLLKSWNPDWMKRGKDFGQSLLDGINEKIPQINSAIETIMSKVNSVYKASESAVKAGTAKVGTIANVNTMVPNAITANIGESKSFNLYVDGKNMASTIAPHMTDAIKARTNTIR